MFLQKMAANPKRVAVTVNPQTISVTTTTASPVGSGYAMFFPGNSTLNECVFMNGTNVPLVQNGFTFGTGDFTMECWFRATRFNLSTYGYLMEIPGGGPTLFLQSVDAKLCMGQAGVGWIYTGSTPSLDTWYNFCVCRAGGTLRTFLNGTVVQSISASNVFSQGASFPNSFIGGGLPGGANPTCGFTGFICEARISRIARYTANYTPQTTPFVNDTNTLLLVHGDNTNGSLAISDDNT
jgi:hypothetical protein